MKKILTANPGLKLLALFIAIVLWLIVVNINDPVDRAVFRGIPVEVLNSDIVSSQDKVYEILDDTDTIDVTVWANRSILDSLRRDNIIATADMEEVNLNDTKVRIKLSCNRYGDRIESLIPSSENLNIRIEDLVRKQLYINATTVGNPANTYILGTVRPEQNLIRLSGPKSIMDRVSRAEAIVDVTGLSRDIRTSARIILYDENGIVVDNHNIKKNIESVSISAEILKTRNVPVEARVSGTAGEGYSITGLVEVDPPRVLLSGSEALINTVNSIIIPDTDIKINGEMESVVIPVDITKYLPNGVSLVNRDNPRVNVTVQIESLTTTDITIDRGAIAFENVPDGVRLELGDNDEYIRMRVRGLAANLAVLPNALIHASVNVGEYMLVNGIVALDPGEYDMPVTLSLPDGVRQDSIHTVNVIVALNNN